MDSNPHWQTIPHPLLVAAKGQGMFPSAIFHCTMFTRDQIVNDQTFESYAIIAKGARDEVLTSRRRTSRVRVQRVDSIATTNHKPSQQNGWRKLLGKTISNPFEAATVVGTVVSITGFVLQFVGLRVCFTQACMI